jgi:hypothetical protein
MINRTFNIKDKYIWFESRSKLWRLEQSIPRKFIGRFNSKEEAESCWKNLQLLKEYKEQ